MNKYEILEGKLTAINAYIDTMCLESNATMEYLKQYKEYVNELILSLIHIYGKSDGDTLWYVGECRTDLL